MHPNRRHIHHALAAATMASLLPGISRANPAMGQLRLLVGYPAGGTTDATARRIAEGLRGSYAQTVVVENRPGARGQLAMNELRRSPADGTTMLLQPEAVVTVVPHVDPKNTSTRLEDLAAVSSCAVLRMALAVGPMVPASVTTVTQFLDWAKRNPAQANYALPGSATGPQAFLISQLARQTHVALNPIPYKGSAPAVIELIGGQVAAMCSPIGDHLPHLQDGRVRVLALASEQRSALAPQLPTFQEQGFEGLAADETSGVMMAKGTAPKVLEAAAQAIAQIVRQPDVVQAFAKLGLEPASATPEQYRAQLTRHAAQWGKRVADAGFQPAT